MSIEEKLKETILSKYRSILEFTEKINMPYATMMSIFKRGINNSSISNIIKISHALGISTDELAKGNIVPISKKSVNIFTADDVDDVLSFYRMNMDSYSNRTIGGMPMTMEDAELLVDALEIAIEMVKRKKRREMNK